MADSPSSSIREAVRARFAQALARRAGAHAGAARRVLDDRLAALESTSPTSAATCRVEPDPPLRGALADLVAHAAREKTAPVLGPAAKPRETSPHQAATGAAADAPTLQFFKRTWSRLSADQRLAQSLATLPGNAGPLNSHHLVHRSLSLMRELSPEYLERFVGYIDALQWLEQSTEAAQDALRAPAAKKSLPARR